MLGFLKRKVTPQDAADAFVAHMFAVANSTFDNWHQALTLTMANACKMDADGIAAFLTHQHEKRPLNHQYAAAILAREAAGIGVCLSPGAADAVMAAMRRALSSGSESHWFPTAVFRYIEADAAQHSMMDQPLLKAFLTDMGFSDSPKTSGLVGHVVWSLPLLETLSDATQGYWKDFAAKSRISV
ncbi:MAG: hypothetical protein KA085_08680 [Phenylobacterium sp.]|jgi:hypothetical protein|uniref:hypothetical protein n=1 Tax=Phenylobacterium sp. TaxID=1871053 RepID=UPI001B6E30E7|nr:hypothetical protein [Phenylobacterium sp.]MBP7816186.1 hypothetical protein [Phenylobacterium sp.]